MTLTYAHVLKRGPRIGPLSGVKAWKMVDLEHAGVVACGRLRVGTLGGYADLENGRRDPDEGRVFIEGGDYCVRHPSGQERRELERFGMHLAHNASDVVIRDNVRIESLTERFAFCMAEEGCDFDWEPHKPKAIFEISDVAEFVSLLGAALGDSVKPQATAARMTYASRLLTPEAALNRGPSAFVKDPYFSREQEIRVVYLPTTAKPEAIVTEANSALATLLRRIR